MLKVAAAEHDLVTTFGRLVEVHAFLWQQLGRSLQQRCGIPHSWFEALVRLSRSEDGRMTMGDLAEQVALTTGGATRLVDRMVAAGYIERVRCPGDRRVSFAALTTAGRGKLHEAMAVHGANLEQVFAAFSPDDVRTLDALLDRLRDRTITGWDEPT